MAEKIIQFVDSSAHRSKDDGKPTKIIPIELATTTRKKQIEMKPVEPEEPIPTELDLVREEISVLKGLIVAIKGGLRGEKGGYSHFFEVNSDTERQALQKNLFEQNRLLKELEIRLKTLKKD